MPRCSSVDCRRGPSSTPTLSSRRHSAKRFAGRCSPNILALALICRAPSGKRWRLSASKNAGGSWKRDKHSTWNGCVTDRGDANAPNSGNYDTNVLALRMYQEMFNNLNFGTASAIAMVLLLAVVPVLVFNLRRFQFQEAIR